jgi:predicted short-subunit dehydrogenase-like oxidoreductase (DUF2520 family)
MDLSFIGSGNTATVLARKAISSGHRILQVYSPERGHAIRLAEQVSAEAADEISSIKKNTDLLIIAVRDEGLEAVAKRLGSFPATVVHTAGAVSIKALEPAGERFGVLYPLQSLRREAPELPPLTLLTDGNNAESRAIIHEFAVTIAIKVVEADDHTRMRYHLAATVVNNFTNYLYIMARQFCQEEKISFTLLQPLMEETILRLRRMSPDESQTGPAWRNDETTLSKHRQLLTAHPSLNAFYEMFTAEILKFRLTHEDRTPA